MAAAVTATLDALLAAPPPLLVVADFDGTLTPGSRDPAAARIEPVARRALRHLARLRAERPDRLAVAILTGRTVLDVAVRTRVGGIDYLGDHGLQSGSLARRGRPERIVVAIEPGFDRHREPAEALASGVAATLGHPTWLYVERKGASVAFHVRQADDVPAARAAVVEAVGAVESTLGLGDHGLAHYRGRSVVDLRPRDAGGKGHAVERLISQRRPGAVVSFGDDSSDADAFDAVRAARSAARITVGATVAVAGRAGPPADLVDRADLVVATARDVGRMLASLARRIEAEG